MDLRADGGITYNYFTGEPNFPFGFGLSYTEFGYRIVENQREEAAVSTSDYLHNHASFVVEVMNTGGRASPVVVLAFVSSDIEGAPLQTLFGFRRVKLAVGETKRLRFTPTAHDLSVVDELGERILRAGNFTIKIGDVVRPAVTSLELRGEDLALPKFEAPQNAAVRSVAAAL